MKSNKHRMGHFKYRMKRFIKRRRNIRRIWKSKPTYFPSNIGPLSKFCARMEGDCNHCWYQGQGANDENFHAVDFWKTKVLKLDGIVAELSKNYEKFMINKILVVVDKFDQVHTISYGMPKDNKRVLPADYNLVNQDTTKLYYRYRFVDAAKITAVPHLDEMKSRGIKFKQFKPRQRVRIKKVFYPKCTKVLDTTDNAMGQTLETLLGAMQAKIKRPRLLIGHGDWSGKYNASFGNQLIYDISFRIRMYVFFTFSSLRSDQTYGVFNEFECSGGC